MRKIFFLTLILLSANLFLFQAYAAEELPASSSSQPENEVNYELPYPGILPDNPLYFLRALRDKAVALLISDPLKKSEFNLLQADKRLNAGIFLFNKEKPSLSLTTISKAENYFSQAIDKMEDAKNQKKDIGSIQGNLRNSIKKHEQELRSLIIRADKKLKSGFEKEMERVVFFEKRLGQ